MYTEQFSLDEGEAILQWPKGLSRESFEEFEDWLQLIIRRAKRISASPREKPADAEAPDSGDDGD